MTEFQLGQPVRYAEHITRKFIPFDQRKPEEPNKQWTGEAYPGKRNDGGVGIIVGKRTLTDGHFSYGYSDEPGDYRPTRHFTAYLVAYDLRRKPVFVLPEHIQESS